MSSGIVFDIKELSVHDGPGIRVTVFLKGCPLRCVWCHNPEGLSPKPELLTKTGGCLRCGRCMQPCGHSDCAPYGRCLHACPKGLVSVCGTEMTAEAVAEKLHRLAPLLVDGGLTLSGGEVLMQPDFACELLERCDDVHRVIETSGYASADTFRRVAERTDLVLLDIKHTDPALHRQYTGADNAPILRNLAWLRESGIPFILRIPVIPGYNDDEANLTRTAALAARGGNLQGVELLKYNPMAGAKYPWVGRTFVPDIQEQLLPDEAPFRRLGLPVRTL